MKCIKCGGEVLPGNSRVIKRNGRKLRQHRTCPTLAASSVENNQQARSFTPRPSEPEPVSQASISQNQTPPRRYFIHNYGRDRLVQLCAGVLTRNVLVEITAIDPEFADANPDMLDGYIEIKVGRE